MKKLKHSMVFEDFAKIDFVKIGASYTDQAAFLDMQHRMKDVEDSMVSEIEAHYRNIFKRMNKWDPENEDTLDEYRWVYWNEVVEPGWDPSSLPENFHDVLGDIKSPELHNKLIEFLDECHIKALENLGYKPALEILR